MKPFVLTLACLSAAFSGLTAKANAYGCYSHYRPVFHRCYRPVSFHCPVYHYHCRQRVWHPSAPILSIPSG